MVELFQVLEPQKVLHAISQVQHHVESFTIQPCQDDKVKEQGNAHGKILGNGDDYEGGKGWIEAVEQFLRPIINSIIPDCRTS